MKICVLGTGSWGTALAQVLSDNGNEVVMRGVVREEIDDININRRNEKYFPNVELSGNFYATDDIEEAARGAEMLLITVPTRFVRSALESVIPYISENCLVVNASKGFDPNTNMRMTDTIRDVIGSKIKTAPVSIIGPSHAEEVVVRRLTSVCAVSADTEAAKKVQHIFSNSYLRLYVNADEIGSEYSVAMKNVIAIASGIAVGQGYGDNAKAAIVTRGLAEMTRYVCAKGGQKDTMLGLCGVGDLVVTCFSVHSRNYQAGLQIGRSDSVEEFYKNNNKTVEGIYSCKVIYDDLKNYGFEMPLVNSLYNVLYLGVKPSVAIKELMERPLKEEQDQ